MTKAAADDTSVARAESRRFVLLCGLAPALITCVLLAGQLTFGFLESWSRTFLAIATAILTELVVVRALDRR